MRFFGFISVLLVTLGYPTSNAAAQSSTPIAGTAHRTILGLHGASDANRSEIRDISPSVFAWAVSPWRTDSAAWKLADEYRSGGYSVMVVPNQDATRYRVTVGRYVSEEEAKRDDVRLPLPVRQTAEIVEVFRFVVGPEPIAAKEKPESDDEPSKWVDDAERSEASPVRTSTAAKPANLPRYPLLGSVEIQLSIASNFDSNIDHDPVDVRSSTGLIPGLLLKYRSTQYKPVFVASFGISRHEYSGTTKWDRTSQMAQVSLMPRLDGSLRARTTGQYAKNGSFEDRDVSDQLQIQHEFEYRFTRDYRLHAYGTLRWKYPKVGNDDAFKPNVGVVFEQKLSGDRTWEIGARYEINDEEIPRGDYFRWTFEMNYEIPVSSVSNVKFEAKHRRKFYRNRTVEVEGDDYLRRDSRWVIGSGLDVALSRNLTAELRYKFEARDSIDPDKPFTAHQVDFGLYLGL